MAIAYTLEIVTVEKIERISLLVSAELLSSKGINDFETFGQSPTGSAIILEAFGFAPTVVILAHVQKSHVDDGEDTIARMLNAVLSNVVDDAVLLYNHEIVIALRRKGHLLLNARSEFWNERRLGMVTLPYTVEPLNDLT